MSNTRREWLIGLGAVLAPGAWAQVLSSPLSPGPSQPQGALGAPLGTGAGVHGEQSPIAPLAPRADVVAWSLLTDVRTRLQGTRTLPVHTPAVRALHRRNVKLHGFMLPLDPGERQRHFLLTSVPMTCAFCVPGGPESFVEVRTKVPVKYRIDAVVVEGRFHVLDEDPYGLFYRLTEAVDAR